MYCLISISVRVFFGFYVYYVVVVVFCFFFFFFQAEDGIRDAQESRGLGDVYKRQVLDLGTPSDSTVTSGKLSGNLVTPGTLDVNGQELILDADADTSITADTDDQIAVSYTHLTLPTNREV